MGERIVVAVKGDGPSCAALNWAAERADRGQGQLVLVNVVDDTPADAASDLETRAARRALEALDDERERIRRQFPHLTVTTSLAHGSVLHALRLLSEDCDLLVIGTHKHGMFSGALLGSLSIRIAAAAVCSVAVIPELVPAATSVVVGVDDTPESQIAADFAAREASAMGDDLIMVCAGYVANPLLTDLVPPVLPGRERAQILARISERVLQLIPTLSVRTRVMDGPAQRALLDVARTARLLVVGHRRQSKLSQLFEGSVSWDVLLGMSTPVVVARDSVIVDTDSSAQS